MLTFHSSAHSKRISSQDLQVCPLFPETMPFNTYSFDRLITRSYLPFCADDKVEKGKTTVDIYQKMLDEIPHVTLPYAKSISKTHATLADLFTAYEAEPRGDKRDRMLIGLPVWFLFCNILFATSYLYHA